MSESPTPTVTPRKTKQGLFDWLRAKRILPAKSETPPAVEPAPMEDGQVVERLTGEASQIVTEEEESPLKLKKHRRPLRRSIQKKSKEQAAPDSSQPGPQEAPPPDFEQVRSTAMQDYVAPEPEKNSFSISRVVHKVFEWLDDRPLWQKFAFLMGAIILFGLGTFLVVMGIGQASRAAAPVPTPVLHFSTPIPASLILSDNQTFDLGVGAISEGKWTPQGPEWLLDTALPRWLSIPWSKSLEATIKGYQAGEPIRLRMSNNDILTYYFQSLEELDMLEMGTFHTNTVELLVILYKTRAQMRWVIVAVP